jgi:hypothetical protein
MLFKQISSIAGKRARVQYTSSLYVDKFEKTVGAHFVKPVSSVLVLNGNIGKPQNQQTYDFLNHCSRVWTDVLYVPGEYELAGDCKQLDIMKKTYKSLENVHVLHNSSYYIKSIDTLFLGGAEKDWLRRKFVEKTTVHPIATKFVALTSYIPDASMVHPIDKKYNINTNYDMYPPVNAWLCGYSRGAFSHTYKNGVVCAYNARGPIDGKNDFNEKFGWSRSAYLDIPDTAIED